MDNTKTINVGYKWFQISNAYLKLM